MDAVIGELAFMTLMGAFNSGTSRLSPTAIITSSPVMAPTFINPVTKESSPVALHLSLETGKPVVQTTQERLAFYEPVIMANQEQALIQAQSSFEYYSKQTSLLPEQQADFDYVKAILARLGY